MSIRRGLQATAAQPALQRGLVPTGSNVAFVRAEAIDLFGLCARQRPSAGIQVGGEMSSSGPNPGTSAPAAGLWAWLAPTKGPHSGHLARFSRSGIQPTEAQPPPSPLQIPVIGSIARGTQWLNCSMRGSMVPRIEQLSR